MKKFTYAAVLCLLTGCAHPQSQTQLEQVNPIKLTAAQISLVKKGVTKSLKDPESARFGKMIAGKDSSKGITVCGYVNAKNSFGGYTGEKPFMGFLAPKGFVPIAIGGTATETMATSKTCQDTGLTL